MSLDGYIGPNDGSTAWITSDPSIDLDALYAEFDTFLMGRKTYEKLRRMGDENPLGHYPASKIIVLSGTLVPEENPIGTVIRDDFLSEIKRRRDECGKNSSNNSNRRSSSSSSSSSSSITNSIN